jgi:hypothetical protein
VSEAVFHYTDISQGPIGIWWTEDGELREMYLEKDSAEETYARQVMTQKLPEADWSDFFQSLEDTTPAVAGWERLNVVGPTGASAALKSQAA